MWAAVATWNATTGVLTQASGVTASRNSGTGVVIVTDTNVSGEDSVFYRLHVQLVPKGGKTASWKTKPSIWAEIPRHGSSKPRHAFLRNYPLRWVWQTCARKITARPPRAHEAGNPAKFVEVLGFAIPRRTNPLHGHVRCSQDRGCVSRHESSKLPHALLRNDPLR